MEELRAKLLIDSYSRASSRRAEPHISDQAPPVWRAPEGPEGTGGLRGQAAVPVGGGRARASGPSGALHTGGAVLLCVAERVVSKPGQAPP